MVDKTRVIKIIIKLNSQDIGGERIFKNLQNPTVDYLRKIKDL